MLQIAEIHCTDSLDRPELRILPNVVYTTQDAIDVIKAEMSKYSKLPVYVLDTLGNNTLSSAEKAAFIAKYTKAHIGDILSVSDSRWVIADNSRIVAQVRRQDTEKGIHAIREWVEQTFSKIDAYYLVENMDIAAQLYDINHPGERIASVEYINNSITIQQVTNNLIQRAVMHVIDFTLKIDNLCELTFNPIMGTNGEMLHFHYLDTSRGIYHEYEAHDWIILQDGEDIAKIADVSAV